MRRDAAQDHGSHDTRRRLTLLRRVAALNIQTTARPTAEAVGYRSVAASRRRPSPKPRAATPAAFGGAQAGVPAPHEDQVPARREAPQDR
jgi:hypothetical protein